MSRPESIRKSSVLVVGGVSWNTMLHVPAFPPPIAASVFPSRWYEAVGSSGAGKALNVAALGIPVALYALIGDDDAGRRVSERLVQGGIELHAKPDPTGTSRHFNLMDAKGRRLSFLAHTGSLEPELDLDELEGLVALADVVMLELVNHARKVIPIARRLRRPIWCDVHDYDGEGTYQRDFVDAADVLLFSGERQGEPRAFMERVHAERARLIVCTLAERGAIAMTIDGRCIEVPTEPVSAIVDSNGAGDAFAAGLLAAIMHRRPIEDALRVGAHAARLALASEELVSTHLQPSDVLLE